MAGINGDERAVGEVKQVHGNYYIVHNVHVHVNVWWPEADNVLDKLRLKTITKRLVRVIKKRKTLSTIKNAAAAYGDEGDDSGGDEGDDGGDNESDDDVEEDEKDEGDEDGEEDEKDDGDDDREIFFLHCVLFTAT